MIFYEKIISSERIFEGKVINLRRDTVELENGYRAEREIIEHTGGVGILAINEKGCVLMVRQYRCGVGRMSLEIPAGKLNPGEKPEECGRRELEEETGCIPELFTPLGTLDPTPAYDSEVIHLFLAERLIPTAQKLDPGEFLTVEDIPLEKAVDMCMTGEITDAKTQIALLKYSHMTKI